jgi:lipopolysaccharide biosynthesis regulator YciM
MGVRSYLSAVAGRTGSSLHYECRECGANLDAGRVECPNCAGGVAVYEF